MSDKNEPVNKIAFTSPDKDGKVHNLAVIRPSVQIQQKGQMIYAKGFAEGVKGGAMLKSELTNHIRERKLWDENKQAEYETIQGRIAKNEAIVKGEVKGTTLSQGKDAAIQLRLDREAIRDLLRERVNLDANTVEGQADNLRFNYFVSACTVNADTKVPYFKDLDDYLTRDKDPVVFAAQKAFANLYYGIDPDSDKKEPENQFLLKYKLCDEELHLIRRDGKKVDALGRLVDDEGYFINEEGKRVNSEGKLVTEEGAPVDGPETFEFVDDLSVPEPKKEEEPASPAQEAVVDTDTKEDAPKVAE